MKITIRDMLLKEFEKSISMGKTHYIEGKAKALNISLEKAKELAQKEYETILPQGMETENHMFYTALVDDKFAGYAWVNIREENHKKSAWGYDIHVDEAYRRQGVAKQIFIKLEAELKSIGVEEVKFHVYADNFRAIPLYEQFGYETTNIVMRKEL